jgi:hypothetical protein
MYPGLTCTAATDRASVHIHCSREPSATPNNRRCNRDSAIMIPCCHMLVMTKQPLANHTPCRANGNSLATRSLDILKFDQHWTALVRHLEIAVAVHQSLLQSITKSRQHISKVCTLCSRTVGDESRALRWLMVSLIACLISKNSASCCASRQPTNSRALWLSRDHRSFTDVLSLNKSLRRVTSRLTICNR